MSKKKRYYRIHRVNKKYNVHLYWGWKEFHMHTFDTYDEAREAGKIWQKGYR